MRQIEIRCFSNQGLVRQGLRVAGTRLVGDVTLTGVRAWLWTPDLSPSGAHGVEIDIKANGVSIFSATTPERLRVLPGMLSSKAAGTPAPVLASNSFTDDMAIDIDVLAEGDGAKGLVVVLEVAG